MPTFDAKPLKEVVPKYVNEAKPGGKYGNIKMDDETIMFVPKAMVSQFTEGASAKVEYETQKWTKGPVQVITKKIGGNGAVAARPAERASTSAKDAAHISTVALAKEFIRRGDTPNDEKCITAQLDKCFRAYMNSLLAGHKQQVAPDMNDEIPESDWPGPQTPED